MGGYRWPNTDGHLHHEAWDMVEVGAVAGQDPGIDVDGHAHALDHGEDQDHVTEDQDPKIGKDHEIVRVKAESPDPSQGDVKKDPDQRVEVKDPQRKKRDQDLSRMKKGQGQDLWKKKKDHDQDQWMIMRGQDHAQVLNDQDHLPRKTTGKMDQGLDPDLEDQTVKLKLYQHSCFNVWFSDHILLVIRKN